MGRHVRSSEDSNFAAGNDGERSWSNAAGWLALMSSRNRVAAASATSVGHSGAFSSIHPFTNATCASEYDEAGLESSAKAREAAKREKNRAHLTRTWRRKWGIS